MNHAIREMLMFLMLAVFWVTPIALGVRLARRKSRSPHWMWFGVHPIGGWIAFAVLASLPAVKDLPPTHGTGPEMGKRDSSQPEAHFKSSLRSTLLVAQVVVASLCFWCVLVYLVVFNTAVLKGDPRRFLVGFPGALFKEPSVIVLVALSLVTLIGSIAGQEWYFRKVAPKLPCAATLNLIVMIVSSILLETIAIHGLVLGFMFGPKSASLSLVLLLTTMAGGALVFPSSAKWFRTAAQGNGNGTVMP